MQAPNEKPTVKLIGTDGNVFAILGRVKQALQRAGADKEYINKFINDATSGDYNHALVTCLEYVEVE